MILFNFFMSSDFVFFAHVLHIESEDGVQYSKQFAEEIVPVLLIIIVGYRTIVNSQVATRIEASLKVRFSSVSE